MSCKSDSQTIVGWKHWNWTAQNKGAGEKNNIFFSYIQKFFSFDGSLILRHVFVQDNTSLPQRQSEKKQNICSVKKLFSPSSAQSILPAFWLQREVEENQNK